MKKLIVVATLLALVARPAYAETVETCTSTQYGGYVCGTTTTTTETITHDVVETGLADNQAFQILFSIAGAAALATGLYKLTYKNYLLG